MRYEDIKIRQDALDMLEAELITMQDYINICRFHNWTADDDKLDKFSNEEFGRNSPNIIQLRTKQLRNLN